MDKNSFDLYMKYKKKYLNLKSQISGSGSSDNYDNTKEITSIENLWSSFDINRCQYLPRECEINQKLIENTIKYNNVELFNKNSTFSTKTYNINLLLQKNLVNQPTLNDKTINELPEHLSLNKINKIATKETSNDTNIDNSLLFDLFNQQRTKIAENIADTTRDFKNNNEEAELHNTMFLYGIPTLKIINLIYKIIERKIKTNMMLGFVELNDKSEDDSGKILITVSEGTLTNDFDIIENFFILIDNLIGLFKKVEIEKIQWEKEKHLNEKYWDTFNEKIKNYFKLKKVNNVLEVNLDEKNNYLINSNDGDELIVRVVFSHKYNADRYIGLKSFIPMKKAKKKSTNFEIKCNNGSTCVEPKLFSYICDYYNTNYPTKYIKGGVAYWNNKNEIGFNKDRNELIHGDQSKYCFEFEEKDKVKLGDNNIIDNNIYVRSLMRKIINENEAKNNQSADGEEAAAVQSKAVVANAAAAAAAVAEAEAEAVEEAVKEAVANAAAEAVEFPSKDAVENAAAELNCCETKDGDDQLTYCTPTADDCNQTMKIDKVLQGCALPCPGCQINYFKFLLNEREIWNYQDCSKEQNVFFECTQESCSLTN